MLDYRMQCYASYDPHAFEPQPGPISITNSFKKYVLMVCMCWGVLGVDAQLSILLQYC